MFTYGVNETNKEAGGLSQTPEPFETGFTLMVNIGLHRRFCQGILTKRAIFARFNNVNGSDWHETGIKTRKLPRFLAINDPKLSMTIAQETVRKQPVAAALAPPHDASLFSHRGPIANK